MLSSFSRARSSAILPFRSGNVLNMVGYIYSGYLDIVSFRGQLLDEDCYVDPLSPSVGNRFGPHRLPYRYGIEMNQYHILQLIRI